MIKATTCENTAIKMFSVIETVFSHLNNAKYKVTKLIFLTYMILVSHHTNLCEITKESTYFIVKCLNMNQTKVMNLQHYQL